MSRSPEIETIRKVWLDGPGYVLVRPWPEQTDCIELCTEPGEQSEGYCGKLSLTFGTSEGLRCLAKALNAAADDMDAMDARYSMESRLR